jgi:hypothetical protein
MKKVTNTFILQKDAANLPAQDRLRFFAASLQQGRAANLLGWCFDGGLMVL